MIDFWKKSLHMKFQIGLNFQIGLKFQVGWSNQIHQRLNEFFE
jgi:hypothetical protein